MFAFLANSTEAEARETVPALRCAADDAGKRIHAVLRQGNITCSVEAGGEKKKT